MRSNKNNTEKTLINWVKKGDFSQTFCSGAELIKQVVYKNVTHEPHAEISICGYIGGGITIFFCSKQLINALLDKCKEAKLFVEDDFCARDLGLTSIEANSASKQDKALLAQFLHCIDSVILLGKEVKREIFNTLNLDYIADEKSFYENLEKLIDEDKLEQATKIAQSDDDDVLWKLGQCCENKQKFSEALSVYQEINENNPHYDEANQQSLHIVMQYLNFIDGSNQSLSPEEKRQYQEAEFKFLLRSNKQFSNQTTIDQHYHQLSGGNDLNPTIRNVSCNEETLLSLATQTASLRNDNHQLKQKNVEQLAKIEELNRQIDQLKKDKNSTSIYSNAFFNSFQEKNNPSDEGSKDLSFGYKSNF